MISKKRLRTLQKRNLLRAYENAEKREHISKSQIRCLKKEMLYDFSKVK